MGGHCADSPSLLAPTESTAIKEGACHAFQRDEVSVGRLLGVVSMRLKEGYFHVLTFTYLFNPFDYFDINLAHFDRCIQILSIRFSTGMT